MNLINIFIIFIINIIRRIIKLELIFSNGNIMMIKMLEKEVNIFQIIFIIFKTLSFYYIFLILE